MDRRKFVLWFVPIAFLRCRLTPGAALCGARGKADA
jgi:hypothetical protein